MKRRDVAQFLIGTAIITLLSGCAGAQNADSKTASLQSNVSAESMNEEYAGQNFSRTDYQGWQEQVADASQDGLHVLLRGNDSCKVVGFHPNGEMEPEVSVSCAEAGSFEALETQDVITYLASSDGETVRIYRLDAQGSTVLLTTWACSQGVLDLMPGVQEDFYLLVGDVVENPAFESTYLENTQVIHLNADGTGVPVTAPTDTEDVFALAKNVDGTILMLSNQRTTDETRVCVYALGDSGVEQLDSFSMGRTRLLSGTGNCLYLSTDNELYTYDPTNQNLTLTAKWVNWGVNGAAVVGGNFLTANQVLLWSSQKTWELSPRETSEDAITLRVGVLEPFELPVQEILDFQSAYPEYQIETVTFEDQNELNLAIASGEDLDLLQIDELDATRYEKNGVFLNLDSYLNGDKDLGSEAFYTKLWDMTRQNDGLYTLMTGFTIQGLYGPQETYGDEQALSLAEFRQGIENSRFYETTVRENAVTWLCSVADFDQNGMLSPDGQENLAEILSLCAGFPADFEQVDFEISGADLPFQWLNLSSLPAAYGLEDQGKALWQTSELDFWGYPTGAGLSFTRNRSYGILSTSTKRAETWVFLRYLLMSGSEDSGIPVRRATDAPLLDRLVSQVNCQALGYASPILAIIQEEAAPCFAGEKTPQATAEVITNRVRIYVGEQQ